MKISTIKLRKYMRRFGITPGDMGEMLCLYVATFETMMREEYLELSIVQARTMLQWFGVVDTLSLMCTSQVVEVMKRNAFAY